jgi:hypothetical protein
MNTFQLVTIPLCLLLAAISAWRRGSSSSRTGGLSWVLLWMVAAVVIAAPQISSIVAGWLGIGRGADLILYLAALSGMVAARYFYCQQRRMEILLSELVRREALRNPVHGLDGARADPPAPPA